MVELQQVEDSSSVTMGVPNDMALCGCRTECHNVFRFPIDLRSVSDLYFVLRITMFRYTCRCIMIKKAQSNLRLRGCDMIHAIGRFLCNWKCLWDCVQF